MLEENYLSYPQAVKEAMGQKVDWSDNKNTNEPLPEVDVILKGLIDELFPPAGYKYELTSTFNSKNSSNLVRIPDTVELSGLVSAGQEAITIIPGDYEYELELDDRDDRVGVLYLVDFEGVLINIYNAWADPETGEDYPAAATISRKPSGLTPHIDPTVPIIDPGSGSGQPPKITNP